MIRLFRACFDGLLSSVVWRNVLSFWHPDAGFPRMEQRPYCDTFQFQSLEWVYVLLGRDAGLSALVEGACVISVDDRRFLTHCITLLPLLVRKIVSRLNCSFYWYVTDHACEALSVELVTTCFQTSPPSHCACI